MKPFRLLTVALLAGCASAGQPESDAGDWPNARGDQGARRYSGLSRINRENVGRLRVAWEYHTGDAGPRATTALEVTPVVVDHVVYLTSADRLLVALDGTSGRELSKH